MLNSLGGLRTRPSRNEPPSDFFGFSEFLAELVGSFAEAPGSVAEPTDEAALSSIPRPVALPTARVTESLVRGARLDDVGADAVAFDDEAAAHDVTTWNRGTT